jgi:hypothetical protein
VSRKPTKGNTPLTTFRLDPELLEALDRIAAHMSTFAGVVFNRSDAVRVLIRTEDHKILERKSKQEKKTKKSQTLS